MSPKRKPEISPDDYWFGISDADLMKMTFLTGDPEDLPGLVAYIPTDLDTAPFVECAYDVTERERKVRCAKCKREIHYHGFVMRTADGRRFLIGSTCGHDVYGADFDKRRTSYTYSSDRRDLLIRLDRLRHAIPAIVGYLADIDASRAFEVMAETRLAFTRRMGRLRNGLFSLLDKRNGEVTGFFLERNFEAERRADEAYERELAEHERLNPAQKALDRDLGYGPKPPQKPIKTWVEKPIGRLRSASFVRGPAPGHAFQVIRQHLVSIGESIDSKMDNRDIWTFLRNVGQLLDNLEAQLDLLEDMAGFFSTENLELIASWAKDHHTDALTTVAAIDRGLQIKSHVSGLVRVQLPSTFRLPSRKYLVDLRADLDAPV